MGVHSFNPNIGWSLATTLWAFGFVVLIPPKSYIHCLYSMVFIPPKSTLLVGFQIFHAPKNTPTFPIPQYSSTVDVLYPRGPAPKDPDRPGPARAALAGNLETTESLPVETQPVQQCGGDGGPTRAAHAQTPRHLPCKYTTLNPARPGSRQSAAPRPSLAGRKPPLPSFALPCLPLGPCRYRDAAAAAPKCGRQRLLSCLLRCRLGHVVAGANLLAMAMAVDTVQGKLLPLLVSSRSHRPAISQCIAGICVAS